MKYYLYIFVLLACFQARLSAQDLQYFFIEDTYQRSYLNPALVNTKNVSFATGLATNVGTDGPVFRDLIYENSDGNSVFNIRNGIDKMKEFNNVYGRASVHTLDVSVNFKIFKLSVGHAWKLNAFLQYSRDLVEIGAYGNEPYIGVTKSIGPSCQYTNYNEIYLGLQKKIGPINVGLRLKNLSGVQTLQTKESTINLTTDDEIYALQIESDYTVVSAGTLDYVDIDDVDISAESITLSNLFSGNNGWAFDVGVSMDINENLELSLGANDIGGMNWDQDATTLTSKGDNSFSGIDLTEYIGTEDAILVEDSLRALLNFEESKGEFSTTLPSQYYLGARFKLNSTWTIGGLFHMTNYINNSRYALAINSTAKWKVLSLGLQAMANNESPFNLGLNAGLHLGPVVVFTTVENILALSDPLNYNYNAVRFGLSINL